MCDAVTNATVTTRAPILKHRYRPDICCAISLERGRISIECRQCTCRIHPSRLPYLRLLRGYSLYGYFAAFAISARNTTRVRTLYASHFLVCSFQSATEFTANIKMLESPRNLSASPSASGGRRNGINSDHEERPVVLDAFARIDLASFA